MESTFASPFVVHSSYKWESGERESESEYLIYEYILTDVETE